MLIEFHRNMLTDSVRNQAFVDALRAVIKPGITTVADIGAGTGFLGFIASQLGAKTVYLYEYSPALKLSQKLARKNHIRGCHFIHQHSIEVIDPPRVDVVISETLGNYAYEENIIETLRDARERYLNPAGVVIPQRLQQFAAPVVHPRYYRELTVWERVGYELDFSPAQELSLNNLYVRTFADADLLDQGRAAQCWDRADFRRKEKSVRKASLQWQLEDAATVYGVAVWWQCELIDGISLSTAPSAPRTHWEQLYFPVLKPLACAAGDMIQLELHSDSRLEIGVNMKWAFTHRRGNEVLSAQSLDMRKGDVE